jgi:glycine/D-amino acid oxidase-like deaminating enzyme
MSGSSGASCRPNVSFICPPSSLSLRVLTFCSWPYKFVHALLRIVLEAGNLNLQAHTPAESVSEPDAAGWITVKTPRGDIRTKTVVHTTNRWASHLLPEFSNIILGDRATLASIKAPEGFIKHTGAQHWDKNVNVCVPQPQEKTSN